MCYIPACSLHTYIFGKVHGPVYPTLISHIDLHVPISYFFGNLVCFGIGLKRLSPMWGSPYVQLRSSTTCKSSKFWKTPPRETPPITNPELDESDENAGEEGGGYIQEDDQLTRVLALRAQVDTRWNSLYFMIQRQWLARQYVLFPAFFVYHT